MSLRNSFIVQNSANTSVVYRQFVTRIEFVYFLCVLTDADAEFFRRRGGILHYMMYQKRKQNIPVYLQTHTQWRYLYVHSFGISLLFLKFYNILKDKNTYKI